MSAQVQQVKNPKANEGPKGETQKNVTRFAEGLVEAFSTILNPAGAGMMQKQLDNHKPKDPKEQFATLILPVKPEMGSEPSQQATEAIKNILRASMAKMDAPALVQKVEPKIDNRPQTANGSNMIAFAKQTA